MRTWPLVVFLVCVLSAGVARAADPVRLDISGIDERPGRMAITLNATGPDGKAINGLSSDSFRVSLNDTPMSLKDVQVSTGGTVPTSVLLLVDVSGSMAGDPINQARQAMQGFIAGLDPNAQLAVMAFDTNVNLLQDFTADRGVLEQALARLTPAGDTALYDAVIQGTQKLANAPPGRHVVVLLTDGVATTGLDKRAASLNVARASGANVFAIGLGAETDKQYLGDLSSSSGGSLTVAPTPAALKQLYADLASAIKSQYTIVLSVPPAVDRSVPVKLTVGLVVKQGTAVVERQLDALPGALPPPFDLNVQGFAKKKSITAPLSVVPVPAKGTTLVRVEYSIDGKPVETEASAPFSYRLDPVGLTPGAHLLRVVATDPGGKQGETQVAFSYVAPSKGGKKIPTSLILVLLPCLLGGALLYLFIKKRQSHVSDYEVRVKPWTGRAAESAWTGSGVEGWPEAKAPVTPPPPPPPDRLQGRLIVMEEEAIKQGHLEAITEYEMRSTPLTFGTGRNCDVRVEDDDQGRIAAEEARIWVQRGRLVYHKLTTLSAMATEGVTSGWLFLDNGEDVRIGAYRIVFQAEVEPVDQTAQEPVHYGPTQEHGMAMRGLWNSASDEPPSAWDSTLKAE